LRSLFAEFSSFGGAGTPSRKRKRKRRRLKTSPEAQTAHQMSFKPPRNRRSCEFKES
jgi:hypothetical protein